jgi:hypothetical protein
MKADHVSRSQLSILSAHQVRSGHARTLLDRALFQLILYMGYRESRPGFRTRATFFSSFLSVSLFGLRSPFLRPGPPCQLPARAGSVKDAHLRARKGFVLDGPEHTGRLGTRRGDDVQRSRDRPLCQPTEKGPLNLISGRLILEPNPYPTCWGRKRPGWTGPIFWPALKP